ncbi:prepilin peptidase [Amnibacterium endophyticum]|uniref:Prepilin peptidase n=1 Tax=Amnibacterium endophyticum TaxID=2109337 RepID=A0ABW4LAU5_9MICO
MLAVARRVPIDEAVVAAALALLAAVAVGPRPLLLGVLWLAVTTPRLVATDVAEHRLPDAVVLPGYPIVLAAVLLDGAVAGRAVLPVLLAGATYGLVLLLLHVTGGMGFGDVKLAPLLGALGAAAAPGGAVLAVVLAFLVGGAAAVVVLVRRGAGSRMPFGPPMLLGAWLALLLAA